MNPIGADGRRHSDCYCGGVREPQLGLRIEYRQACILC